MTHTEPELNATRIFEKGDIYSTWDDDYYHPVALPLFDAAIDLVLRAVGAQPGDDVLDAGCGPGAHSIRAARWGCKVRAFDVSNTVLDEARRRSESAGVSDSISFEQQDMTRLSFADGSFRRVFSWGVVTHIPEIEKALDELARILAPGGRIALETTNRSAWDHRLMRFLRRLLRRPKPEREDLPFGEGGWYDVEGERLWVWHVDTEAVTAHMSGRGLRRIHRRAIEFTNLHWRIGGFWRLPLLHANNLWFRARFPAGPAVTNLLVFEKEPATG